MASSRKFAFCFCLMLASHSILVDAMLLKRHRAGEVATMLAGGLLTLLFTEVMDKPHGALTFGRPTHGVHNFGGLSHGDIYHDRHYPGGIHISQHPSEELPFSREFTLGKLRNIFSVRRHSHTTSMGGHRSPHFLSELAKLHPIRSLGHGASRHTNSLQGHGTHGLAHTFQTNGLGLQFFQGGKYGHSSGMTHLNNIHGLKRFGSNIGFTRNSFNSNHGLRHIINSFGQDIPIGNFEHEIVPLTKINGIPLEFSNIPLNIDGENILHAFPRNSEGVSISYSSS